MNTLLRTAIGKTRMVMAALVLLVLAGAIAYVRIPKEALPTVAVPLVYVAVSLEGISPDDSERLLVRPIEEEVRNIEGIAEDGTIEAISVEQAKTFALGVQWHAEYDPQKNPINQVLFEAFGSALRQPVSA